MIAISKGRVEIWVAALAALVLGNATQAAAPMMKTQPGFYRMMLGEFEVTALNDGVIPYPTRDPWARSRPHLLRCRKPGADPDCNGRLGPGGRVAVCASLDRKFI